MKSVLMSIQPKWCELIASGKKTVEVRKIRPKIDTPFKCYIYETKAYDTLFGKGKPKKLCVGGGRVIGEFVCDRICPICYTLDGLADVVDCNTSCLNPKDFIEYGKGKTLYGWHIKDLVIYDKPKELSEFRYYNPTVKFENGYPIPTHEIKRPPQSWCYVEGGEG